MEAERSVIVLFLGFPIRMLFEWIKIYLTVNIPCWLLLDLMSGDAIRGSAMRDDAMSGDAIRGNAMRDAAMSGDSVRGNAMRDDAMSGDAYCVLFLWMQISINQWDLHWCWKLTEFPFFLKVCQVESANEHQSSWLENTNNLKHRTPDSVLEQAACLVFW